MTYNLNDIVDFQQLVKKSHVICHSCKAKTEYTIQNDVKAINKTLIIKINLDNF